MKKFVKWLPAAATLLLAGVLIVQCLQMYFAGTAAENMENGALIRDIFSRETVVSRLRGIAWAFWLWLGALIVGLVCRIPEKALPMDAETRLKLARARVLPTPEMEAEALKRRKAARICGGICLFCGALALVWLLLPGSFDSWDLEGELAAMIAHLLPLALVCLAAMLARAELAQRSMLREVELSKGAPKRESVLPVPAVKEHKYLRIALYAAAIVLVALGVSNGGMRDVLVKAINICTECIGLG